MGTLFIQSETLTNIADAIREKAGTSTTMSPSQMVSAIGEISGGGSDLVDFIENEPSGIFENSEISKVRNSAFYYCYSLQSVNLPVASYIGSSAFYRCSSLQSVSLPNASYIGSGAFMYCSSLQFVNLPNANYIGSSAFIYGYTLQSVNLPVASYIGSVAFRSCYNLLSLYLGSISVCSLAMSNAFASTPMAGYTTSTGGVYGSIYVPASLLTSYKTATNWAVFSSRFVGV